MSPRKRFYSFVIAIVFALILSAPAGAERRVNLVPNGGFETAMPDPWRAYHSGELTLHRDSEQAHSGDFYGTFHWRSHVEGGYSALLTPHMNVQAGTPYRVGLWARGKGTIHLWIFRYTESNKYQGGVLDAAHELSDTWTYYERSWTPLEGHAKAVLALRLTGQYADLDDVEFSFDAEKYPPPRQETIEISSAVLGTGCEAELFVNGERAPESVELPYGAYALAVKVEATGEGAAVSGAVTVGDFEVPLDSRWRVAPMPQDDEWMEPGFDDTSWEFASAREGGVWGEAGSGAMALRRVVLWKMERVEPPGKNQWINMIRDRMFLPEGGAQVWVSIIRPLTDAPASQVTLHLEVPAFLTLLDKKELGTSFYSNWWPRSIDVEPLRRDGVDYNHHKILYDVPGPEARFDAWAALYFKIDDEIPEPPDGGPYVWRYWREANGNITDVPTSLPIVVTGPINGRQCEHFQLVYNRSGGMHSGGWGTFSLPERRAIAESLVACGMNVAFLGTLSEKSRLLEHYLFYQDNGVKFYSTNFNGGMTIYPHYDGIDFLKEHPEYAGKMYGGDPQKFKDAFHEPAPRPGAEYAIWCQEYVARGGEAFYERLRPRLEEELKLFPSIKYWMWDWEGIPMTASSFTEMDLEAFRKFAGIPQDVELTDELIVENYPEQWIRFREDQTARHIRSMIDFLDDYGVELTVWMPGSSWKSYGLDLSLVEDVYTYHFMGWPGSDLPYYDAGQSGGIAASWRAVFGDDIHLVAQSIVNNFRSVVIDERMFKVWTINAALGTAGGGWFMWMDSMYPFGQSAGMSYFLGEATRMIDAHQDTFRHSRHVSDRFSQQGLEGRGSGLVALEGPEGNSILVLLINQKDGPAEVTVKSDAVAGWSVRQWEGDELPDAAEVRLIVPQYDVIALDYGRD